MMTDSNGNMIMPVAPYYGGNNNDGMFGGNGSWMWFLLRERLRFRGFSPFIVSEIFDQT